MTGTDKTTSLFPELSWPSQGSLTDVFRTGGRLNADIGATATTRRRVPCSALSLSGSVVIEHSPVQDYSGVAPQGIRVVAVVADLVGFQRQVRERDRGATAVGFVDPFRRSLRRSVSVLSPPQFSSLNSVSKNRSGTPRSRNSFNKRGSSPQARVTRRPLPRLPGDRLRGS